MKADQLVEALKAFDDGWRIGYFERGLSNKDAREVALWNAMPHIEKALREQIARDIEALAAARRDLSGASGRAYDSGNSALLDAARIARGGAS